jgi:hypothetical protein
VNIRFDSKTGNLLRVAGGARRATPVGRGSLRDPQPSIACLAWLVLVMAANVLGCSGGASNRRPTKPVTVTVTYKGAPVSDATVTFISQDAEPSSAYGKTDSQGMAKLKTYAEGDGAVLGKQKVIINKEQILNNVKVADQDSPDYVPLPPGGAPVPQVKHLIPQKYAAPGETPLTAEVTASGPNTFTFELTD